MEEETKRRHIIHSMTKADILLIIICFLTAFFLGIIIMLHRNTGSMVRVSCDGMEIRQIALGQGLRKGQTGYYLVLYEEEGTKGLHVHVMHSEEKPELPTGQSYNLFSVTDDTVRMEAADCRDQICVNHKPISDNRENIICLPHRLLIEIHGDVTAASATEPPDGVVR